MSEQSASKIAFINRILPAPVNKGFAMEDYWVWCGSVIKGEDGRYHIFAARWPNELPFFDGYKTHSEIVHALSPTPEGPYKFHEIALPDRGPKYWDGRMTHNPTIHKVNGTYLLFYIGSTYKGTKPGVEELLSGKAPQPEESYSNIRIGLAASNSVFGPWERLDSPILSPRAGKWDSSIVTNPAVCVLDDGRLILIYRSNTPNGLKLGVAMAENFESPFKRISDNPILEFKHGNFVEDPYIWRVDDHFELIAKDMTGGLTGEKHAGIHASSKNFINWQLCEPAKSYSRRIRWEDGTVTEQGCVERPQLLIENSQPTHLFAATGDGPGGFDNCTKTWNMVIPLKSL